MTTAQAAAPQTTASPSAPSTPPAQIEIRSPATGEPVGSVTPHTAAQVREAVARAREAQQAWGQLTVRERCHRLKAYHAAIHSGLDEILDLLCNEGGKSRPDALSEASSMLIATQFYLSKGPRILKSRRLKPWLMKQLGNYILYAPRGVVGIISPWNYPFVIPLYECFAAWVAGNAVVLKPSEWTPLVAQKAKQIWDATGMPPSLFEVVQGYGDVGAALIDSGIDKIHFTGSVKVGRIVARSCGERLVPCTLELGGKAPAVVTEDAPLDEVASALTWGGFFNCGQTCIGVERVYAVGSAAEPLARKIAEHAARIRVGNPSDPKTEFGAMVFPQQLETVRRQVDQAVQQGARVLAGGRAVEGPGRFYPPTVLADCTQQMEVMHEETFGPVIPVMQVASVQQAVELANTSHLGLNAYVFARGAEQGRRIAEQLRAGSVLVGDVIYNYALPELPFGGIKASGIGRSHGEEGLRSMCEARMISYNRLPSLPITKLLRYPYSERTQAWLRKLLSWRFGR